MDEIILTKAKSYVINMSSQYSYHLSNGWLFIFILLGNMRNILRISLFAGNVTVHPP